jgi:hypothetical protein
MQHLSISMPSSGSKAGPGMSFDVDAIMRRIDEIQTRFARECAELHLGLRLVEQRLGHLKIEVDSLNTGARL